MTESSVTSKSPTVTISQDRMQAILRIPADVAPHTVRTEAIMELLEDTGIPAADDIRDHVDAAVKQFIDSPRETRLVVAQGIPPQRGADGRLDWEGEFGPTGEPPPPPPESEDAGATPAAPDPNDDDAPPINYYEQSPFVSVKEGEHIATLIAPEPGLPGFDVFGQRLPPLAGQPFPLRINSGVRLDALGRVKTTQAGLLACGYNTIHVNPVLEIPGPVDFSTGNIDFDGSVVIGDGIRDRFKVKAAESMIVSGLIEAARIECRGNLRCEGGMAGRDAGSIDIGGDAALRYLVGVSGQVGRDLLVRREIINCRLTVARRLELAGGALIGGEVIVDRGVKVAELGSDAAVPTVLRLGRVPVLSDLLNRIAPRLTGTDEQLRDLKQRREEALSRPDRDDGRVQQIDSAIEQLAAQREQLRSQMKQARTQFNARCGVDLEVFRAIHPGVTIVLPRVRIRFVETVRGPVVIRRAADGKIRIDHADGEAFDLRAVATIATTQTW